MRTITDISGVRLRRQLQRSGRRLPEKGIHARLVIVNTFTIAKRNRDSLPATKARRSEW